VSLKHAGVDVVHLEAKQIGHTISWYPQQTRFFSSPQRIAIAGIPLATPDQTKATGEQYLAYLRGIVEYYDLKINTYEPATRIERNDNTFTVTTTKATYHANKIVLAIGDMHAPRRLDVPGEYLPHVSHYFVEPHRYFRQKLLIVGGRNSAVEAALRCHSAGAQVTLSYRQLSFDEKSVKYWLHPEIKALIKANKITYLPQTQVSQICKDHVVLEPNQMKVDADFVLLLTGYVMDPTLLQMAGIELAGENDAPMFDSKTMQTNVPNIYIAGTAAAGTQNRFRLFIENCHPHVVRITRAITGNNPPPHLVNAAAKQFDLPES